MNRWVMLLWCCFSVGACADTVWVEQESYHTALVVPASAVLDYAPALQTVIGDKPYVRFGWGNREYYGSSQKSVGKALKALFVPGPSVVEVAGFADPEKAGRKVVALTVSARQSRQLLAFIVATFKLDVKQAPELVRVEPTGFRYYAAQGNYHALRNCNNWTAQALRQGGLDVRFRGAFLAGQVMGQVE